MYMRQLFFMIVANIYTTLSLKFQAPIIPYADEQHDEFSQTLTKHPMFTI